MAQDPRWPEGRIAEIIGQTLAAPVFTEVAHLDRIYRAVASANRTVPVVLIGDPRMDADPLGDAGSEAARQLWVWISGHADPPRAAGFNVTPNGPRYSPAEIDDYVERVVRLTVPGGATVGQVLEVPCGTGSIAPSITNVFVVLLDPDQQPVEDGDISQICVGEAEVTQGHHNDPELTTQRFVTLDDWAGHWFETGDIPRWQAGQLWFDGLGQPGSAKPAWAREFIRPKAIDRARVEATLWSYGVPDRLRTLRLSDEQVCPRSADIDEWVDMGEPVIEVKDLARTFQARSGIFRRPKKAVEAVKGINFVIERGELFGLLGPNGAGKTTTIKMLITLLLPTSGQAKVLGYDVVQQPRVVRRKVGYVFGGDRGFYERLSGLDNLRYFAELYGVLPQDSKRRIGELLELVGLAGREKERVEGYSRGMRQRLHLARGLLHRPEVLFLDEPSIGIDPVGARELRTTVKNLVEAGTTVLLTTHYMFEADELCDRIAVIAGGRIVALDTPEALKRRVTSGTVLEIDVFGLPDGLVDRVRAEPDVQSAVITVQGQAHVLTVYARPETDVSRAVMRHLEGSRLGRVNTRQPTLEDAYVELVKTA